MTMKGTYSSVANYSVDDVVVSAGGNVFRCVKSGTGNALENTECWRMLIDPLEDVVLMMNNMKSTIDTAIASVLPSVAAADNGKVLTVVNGKWDKAALPE